MPTDNARRRLILCAGLQSGGTTLISWCFLQRRDTNGVLDMPHDVIYTTFERVREPVLWVKMTVAAFRWLDVSEVYRDLGWRPEPLLVVRDVRAAYASLLTKYYGFNGTTAEEPPLRLRFRRFLRDWELFQASGWPILKYEDVVRDEHARLRAACAQLALPWDEGMVGWPKPLEEIAYAKEPNATFAESIGKGSFSAAKRPEKAEMRIDRLPRTELEWLEETFADYNRVHDYPAHIHPPPGPAELYPPRFEGTKREWWVTEYHRLYDENERLRAENERHAAEGRPNHPAAAGA
jgi:hypothetical protein